MKVYEAHDGSLSFTPDPALEAQRVYDLQCSDHHGFNPRRRWFDLTRDYRTSISFTLAFDAPAPITTDQLRQLLLNAEEPPPHVQDLPGRIWDEMIRSGVRSSVFSDADTGIRQIRASTGTYTTVRYDELFLAVMAAAVVLIPSAALCFGIFTGIRRWLTKPERLLDNGLCPRCRYDISRTNGSCPECGGSISLPSRRPPRPAP